MLEHQSHKSNSKNHTKAGDESNKYRQEVLDGRNAQSKGNNTNILRDKDKKEVSKSSDQVQEGAGRQICCTESILEIWTSQSHCWEPKLVNLQNIDVEPIRKHLIYPKL